MPETGGWSIKKEQDANATVSLKVGTEKGRIQMQQPVSCRRSNCLALLILAGAGGFAYVAFEPQPAGAHVATTRSARELAKLLPSAPTAAPGKTGGGEAATAGPALSGRLAVLLNMTLLQEGKERLLKSPSYTALFLKQEKIGKKPLDELQTIEMKLRHEPFSVYMKWLTVKEGQEVLYVDGELDNRMLVKKGGLLSRMPSIKLAPDSPLALRESRHPVTDAGILSLTEKLLKYRRVDVGRLDKMKCEVLTGQMIGNRPCYYFEVTYADPETEPLYRKSLMWIDEELSLPICVKNYTWESAGAGEEAEEEVVEEEVVEETEDGGESLADATPADPTLIEFYTFTDIAFEKETNPNSFDSANKEYSFKRQ